MFEPRVHCTTVESRVDLSSHVVNYYLLQRLLVMCACEQPLKLSNGGLFPAYAFLQEHLLQDDLFRRFFAAVPKIIEPVLMKVASHDLIEFWILIL